MLLKLLLVLTLGFFLFRGMILRRWPDFGRRVQIVLVLSLIAVTLFRVMIMLRE